MRFHPSVNLSILKFLGFEQTFKNALTTLPMGGGKGGSDFDPKGKSQGEIMRFCQALMTELYRHLGPDTDVPAGDIGVGGREVGFMAGMMKKLSNNTACVFTGKGLSFGGSLIRPEATGYGLVYFTDAMLQRHGLGFGDAGGGVRLRQRGAVHHRESAGAGRARDHRVGFRRHPGGRRRLHHREAGTPGGDQNQRYGRVADYARERGLTYLAGQQPWNVPVDIALPCATQNELDLEAAQTLIRNG